MSTVIFLKQTGELLGDKEAPIEAEQVQTAARRIKYAAGSLANLGVAGLMIVSGGGNIMRGRSFLSDPVGENLSRRADAIARLGTMMNTLALEASLADLGVPSQAFAAPGMNVTDRSIRLSPFDLDAANQAYRAGKVVLVGGGIGEDGCTTDKAVVSYAIMQAQAFGDYGLNARPYKATGNVDGVYTRNPHGDPDESENADFLRSISAADALAMGIGVVDKPCLETLAAYAGVPSVGLRVYNASYSLPEVVHSENVGSPIGSLILSGLAEAA